MKKVLILILAVILSLSVFAMAACQQPCETHVDGNHDGICDVCEEAGLSVTHTDSNHDGKCDGCGTATTFEHVDAAHDGKCDVCNQDVEVIHVDADGDGFCDVTACGHKYEWVDALADAKEYVDGLYLRGDEITAVDFEITTVVSIGGVKYNVDWEIQSTVAGQTAVALGEIDADTKQQKVNVDEFSGAEVAYKLVATVSDAEGHSVKVEYARKVPQFVVSSYEEYLAHCKEADGVSFTIRAYVIGAVSVTSSSKGSLYLQDADGNGYYAYAPSLPADATASEEALDAYFPFGTEVCVTGTGTVYGGQYEFNKGCQIVKTGNVATAEQLPFENVTEVWGSAKNQGDHDVLMQDQNKLVVLEEAIFTKADDKYYYFTVNGVQYNIYKTNYFMADQADIDALFAKFEVGKAATIKGIVSCYSNLYQIYPLDVECISNVHAPELSDAQKVAFEKGNLLFESEIAEDCAIELPSAGGTYEAVSITWALAETYNYATIADGKLNVTLPSEMTTLKVVATLQCGDATDTVEFEVKVYAKVEQEYILKNITSPATGTYKMSMYQGNLEKTVYLTGVMDGYYYGTSEHLADAVDVTIAAGSADGKYTLSFVNAEGATKYLAVVISGTYTNVVFQDTAADWTWNAELGVFTTEAGGSEYFLGTRNDKNYATFSACKTSYVDNFKAQFGKLVTADWKEVVLTSPATGTYKMSMYQGNLAKTVYFTGVMDGYYYGTSEHFADAVDVTIAAGSADGKYTLSFVNAEGATKYLAVVISGTYTNVVFQDTAADWTWNAELGVFTTEAGGSEYFLGTRNDKNYATFSACKTSYVDNFKAQFVKFELAETGYVTLTSPATGTYKMSMYQGNLAKTVYFTGVMDGYYYGTSEHFADAVDVTIAAGSADGKYTLSFVNAEGATKYLAVVISGTYTNVVFQDTAADWTWNAELGVFTTEAGGSEYFLGTRNDKNYATFSACKTSYVDNFKAQFGKIDFIVDAPVVPTHKCESVCPECGKCTNEDCAEAVCSDKCEGHPAAVVINGVNYTESQVQEALLALKAGDVVEIRTNGTIDKEYTFVAANYTLGEGAVLTVQANAVAPAGTKLTVGAKSVIVVESGATIDISALTQDDFATSTEARLEIANGATVIMPAYTEALWNDAYLKVVIEAMVADSDFGAKLVLGETTLTKTHAGWVAQSTTVVETASYTLVIPSESATWSADTLINDIFYASNKAKTESIKIAGASYEADGLTFSGKQISLTGGKVQYTDGAWLNSIFFTVPAGQQAKVVVYAAQKEGKTASLKVMNADAEEVAVAGLMINGVAADAFDTLPTTSVSKYEFTLAEGTYYIGGSAGGAYVYGMKVALCETVVGHVCETICLECGKCLDAECTESACAEKCEGHKPAAVTATISFADKANRTVFTTSQQVWVQNGITITNNKAASTSNVADYAKPARFYASTELIVEAEGQITEIVFHCNSGKPAISLGTIEGATVTKNGYVVTVTFEAPVDSFTVAKLSAQVRMDSIDVTYIPA